MNALGCCAKFAQFCALLRTTPRKLCHRTEQLKMRSTLQSIDSGACGAVSTHAERKSRRTLKASDRFVEEAASSPLSGLRNLARRALADTSNVRKQFNSSYEIKSTVLEFDKSKGNIGEDAAWSMNPQSSPSRDVSRVRLSVKNTGPLVDFFIRNWRTGVQKSPTGRSADTMESSCQVTYAPLVSTRTGTYYTGERTTTVAYKAWAMGDTRANLVRVRVKGNRQGNILAGSFVALAIERVLEYEANSTRADEMRKKEENASSFGLTKIDDDTLRAVRDVVLQSLQPAVIGSENAYTEDDYY